MEKCVNRPRDASEIRGDLFSLARARIYTHTRARVGSCAAHARGRKDSAEVVTPPVREREREGGERSLYTARAAIVKLATNQSILMRWDGWVIWRLDFGMEEMWIVLDVGGFVKGMERSRVFEDRGNRTWRWLEHKALYIYCKLLYPDSQGMTMIFILMFV